MLCPAREQAHSTTREQVRSLFLNLLISGESYEETLSIIYRAFFTNCNVCPRYGQTGVPPHKKPPVQLGQASLPRCSDGFFAVRYVVPDYFSPVMSTLTFSRCQISSTYSCMVLSDENLPTWATFKIALCAQAAVFL